jgi:hypothetical protein
MSFQRSAILTAGLAAVLLAWPHVEARAQDQECVNAQTETMPVVESSPAESPAEPSVIAEPRAQISEPPPAPSKIKPWRINNYLPKWFSLTGSIRGRYEALTNNFRPERNKNDQALQMRTLIEAGFHVGAASFVGELQDSRAYLTDINGNVSTIVVNAVELLQGYFNLHLDDAVTQGSTLDLRLGWQTMDLGGRRLVARNRFRNTIQNYTGLTADWKGADKSELFAFFVLPIRVLPPNTDRQGLVDNQIKFDQALLDFRFWGAHYKRAALPFNTTGEVYLFVLGEDPDRSENRTRPRRVYTPGIRLLRDPKRGALDFDIEVVLQGGNLYPNPAESDLHVFAQFVHTTFGYTFDVSWSPRLSAELDYASGEDPDDGRWGRFNTLFGPRRTEFGPTGEFGLLGRENIISQGLRFGVKPAPRFDAFVSYRANFLDSRTDVFARSGVQDPTGQSGRFAGHQIEIRTRLWLLQDVILWELGGAVFINGEFMRTAPGVNGYGDPLYVYSDLGFVF